MKDYEPIEIEIIDFDKSGITTEDTVEASYPYNNGTEGDEGDL